MTLLPASLRDPRAFGPGDIFLRLVSLSSVSLILGAIGVRGAPLGAEGMVW